MKGFSARLRSALILALWSAQLWAGCGAAGVADGGGSQRAGASDSSRFGLDYVFPLTPTFQQEQWPRRYAEAKLKWVNFALVNWAALEPNPPVGGRHHYRWDGLDRAVLLWERYGFQIVMSLRLRKGWFSGPIRYRPKLGGWASRLLFRGSDRLPAPEHRESYRAWIAALVERYDGDGTDDMPGLIRPVLHYQIGNEYGNPVFWTGTADDYGELLKDAYRAAKRACPQVKIVCQGLRANDLFHNDPEAKLYKERFERFVRALPPAWQQGWRRVWEFNEKTLALADYFDIVDAGGNGPCPSMSAGYICWVRRELAKHGVKRPIWDMEARSEPRLVFNRVLQFHAELTVPGGRRLLRELKRGSGPDYERAMKWYRAEQARVLVQVFVARFAAGFEKVFMGMPNDWDRSLSALTVSNPFIGICDRTGKPWPAFYALRMLVEQLDGFQRAERVEGPAGVELYRFSFGGGRPERWVAWLAEDHTRGPDEPLPQRTVRLAAVKGPVRIWRTPVRAEPPHAQRAGEPGKPLVLTITPMPVLIEPAE